MCFLLYMCFAICVFCFICILLYMCFAIYVFCYICVLLYKCFAIYVFCYIGVLLYKCFAICVFFHICVLLCRVVFVSFRLMTMHSVYIVYLVLLYWLSFCTSQGWWMTLSMHTSLVALHSTFSNRSVQIK